jgi:sortase A
MSVARLRETILVIVMFGLGLLGYALFGLGSPASAAEVGEGVLDHISDAPEEKTPKLTLPETNPLGPPAPEDKTLKLTVPEMKRVEDVPVYHAPASDEGALRTGALHVRGTDFPWHTGAINIYIAGHRLGYSGTKSYLVFWDLDKLENGDEVILTDANGTRYTYEVFKEFVANPSDVMVMQPIAGKNIVTLQTCTLPDYKERLIVQAELQDIS